MVPDAIDWRFLDSQEFDRRRRRARALRIHMQTGSHHLANISEWNAQWKGSRHSRAWESGNWANGKQLRPIDKRTRNGVTVYAASHVMGPCRHLIWRNSQTCGISRIRDFREDAASTGA
jgi:hypothetical protein